MQRLAALVPRPRLNLIRFHGVLAPNAKLRPEIIPSQPLTDTVSSDASDDAPYHSPAARMSWARLLKRVFNIDVEHWSGRNTMRATLGSGLAVSAFPLYVPV